MHSEGLLLLTFLLTFDNFYDHISLGEPGRRANTTPIHYYIWTLLQDLDIEVFRPAFRHFQYYYYYYYYFKN